MKKEKKRASRSCRYSRKENLFRELAVEKKGRNRTRAACSRRKEKQRKKIGPPSPLEESKTWREPKKFVHSALWRKRTLPTFLKRKQKVQEKGGKEPVQSQLRRTEDLLVSSIVSKGFDFRLPSETKLAGVTSTKIKRKKKTSALQLIWKKKKRKLPVRPEITGDMEKRGREGRYPLRRKREKDSSYCVLLKEKKSTSRRFKEGKKKESLRA